MKNVIGFTSLVTLSALFVGACVSKSPEREDFSYTIADASLQKRPEWIEDLSVLSKEDSEYKYFIGDFENINKTLCQKGAEARASEMVVSEVKQKINSRFVDDVVNVDNEVNQQTGAALEKNLKSKLGGIETVASYWELKNYKVEMGADADGKMYSCYSVVRVKKSTLDNFANTYNANTLKKQNAKADSVVRKFQKTSANKVASAKNMTIAVK